MRNKIFEKYNNLVSYFAKKYYNTYKEYNITLEDLIQEGFLGLIFAERNYDETKKVLFSTYASYWIKKMMLKYINKNKPLEVEAIEDNQFYYYENYDDIMIQNEKSSNIDKISKFLDLDLEQKIFRLFFVEGLPLDEISRILNIRREKVRQVKEKIVRKLKVNKEPINKLL